MVDHQSLKHFLTLLLSWLFTAILSTYFPSLPTHLNNQSNINWTTLFKNYFSTSYLLCFPCYIISGAISPQSFTDIELTLIFGSLCQHIASYIIERKHIFFSVMSPFYFYYFFAFFFQNKKITYSRQMYVSSFLLVIHTIFISFLNTVCTHNFVKSCVAFLCTSCGLGWSWNLLPAVIETK